MGQLARRYGPWVALGLLAAAYLADPDGPGGLAFFGTAVFGLVSFAVGPLLHRPTNPGPWRWLTGAGAFFLVGLLLRLGVTGVGSLPGPAGNADLWAFAGYGCIALFLAGLLRRTRSAGDRSLWLDTAAMTTASALVGWVMSVAPELTGEHPHLGQALVNAVYPVMDATLLALTVQLGFRRGTALPTLRAALVGLSALLVGDFAYTFVWAADPQAVNPYVNVCYMVAYAGLGFVALHPSMRELSDVDVPYVPRLRRARLALVLLALMVPASVPAMVPTHGRLDGAVRGLIMAVFGGLVFMRLVGTVSALLQAEERARYRAAHDPLTDLPNRPALLARLAEGGPEASGWLNVLLVDCADFARINDRWGYEVGDSVLVQVAGRLRALAGDVDRLARVGGDQFVVCLDADDESATGELAARVVSVFGEPFAISGHRTVPVKPVVGIARAARGGGGLVELVARAELALTHAKNANGSSSTIYHPSMHEKVVRRHQLADALRGALARGEIHVAYQPIRGGPGFADLTGWEALARWHHPEFGAVSPLDFIPIAEDTGLIVEIGAFVLRTAAADLRRWQRRFGRDDLHVSVNVSSVQLLRDDILGQVTGVLRRTGLPREALWLEITESVVVERTDEILTTLHQLAALGVRLCMDDFGTGYSSMSYLKDFPVHILKIDRAFVRNMVEDQRDRELSKAMIGVAAALGLAGVVAEGVENVEQAEVLLALGCSMAQGYLYGKPVSAAEAEAAAAEVLRPLSRPVARLTP